MCLNVRDKQCYTAEEDIVVYKRLTFFNTEFNTEFSDEVVEKYNGKAFKAVINHVEILGVLSFNYNGKLFLCSNDERFNGLDTDEKYGYQYSWALDSNVYAITVDKELATNSKLKTPYQMYEVKIGETYISDLILEGFEVNKGIHSFRFLRDAKEDASGNPKSIFVKCIIPKGAKYYAGLFCASESYASDTLKYVEVCAT